MALRDVMSHAVEVEKETRKVSGPPHESGAGRAATMVLSLVLLGFTVFVYASRPEFIFGANPNQVPAVRRDANIRFTMYLLSRRVESYRKASNRLPDDLSAIPGAPQGVSYARLSDAVFELRANDGSKVVVFRSNEPVDRFLGESPRILSGRTP